MFKMFQGLRPGRGCTKFIACSNSNGLEKFMADDVLTGTNDHTKINAMLTTMGKGTLLLGTGTVTIDGTITYTTTGQFIRGSGVGATTITIPNSATINTGLISGGTNDCGLLDLSIDGNKANNASQTGIVLYSIGGENFLLQNVVAKNSPGNGANVAASAYGFRAINSEVSLAAFVGLVVSPGTTTNKVGALIQGCRFDQNLNYGLYLAGSGARIIGCAAASNNGVGFGAIAGGFANSFIGCEANVNITQGFDLAGDACVIDGCIAIGNGSYGVALASGTGHIVTNSTIYGNGSGISLLATSPICENNIVYRNNLIGITVACQDGQITNNYCFQNGAITDNTYSNIEIQAAGDNCNVQGNTCRKGPVNRSKYGINILAGATANYVKNNDLLTGGQTASYNDAGTSTDTTSANRV